MISKLFSRLCVTTLISTAALMGSACAQEPTPHHVAPVVPQPIIASAGIASAGFDAPADAWRTPNQDDLMYIYTDHGLIIVELATEISPNHVAQIKTLTSQGFYDHITFHRVIDGFMNQTGDPTGTGTGDSDEPNLKAEFTFRRDPSMAVTLIGQRPVSANNPNNLVNVGYYKSFPVATQPSAQAALSIDGKVPAWGLHCPGATSMARANDVNSGNSQFFLMRHKSPDDLNPVSHLDTQYTFWGMTVHGLEHVDKIKIGTKGEQIGWVPDQMRKVRIGSALPENEQVNVQVLKTSGPHFARFIETQKEANGEYKDICRIELPSRAG